MEPTTVIIVFCRWLQDNPDLFLPTAWRDLPQLDKNLAEIPNSELFFIAHTIGKWCGQHNLGEKLRVGTDRLEIDDPPDNTSDSFVIENYIPVLHQGISDLYNELIESSF